MKQLGLSQPGFRQEALGEVQRCDLLADELRAAPERRAAVIEALRAGLERPVLATAPLSPPLALDLVDACMGEDALALALWRVLADPDPAVRAEARPFLARLAAHHYGPAPQDGSPVARGALPEDPAQALAREREELARKLEEARRKLEQADGARRERAKEERGGAGEAPVLAQGGAGARGARRRGGGAGARGGGGGPARAGAPAAGAGCGPTRGPRRRGPALRSGLKDAEARASALEGRLERARERERELEAGMERVRAASAGEAGPRARARGAAGEAPLETDPDDVAAAWLMPVYTREFYDSLEGWDRRIQRAAFKQAALLAQDHRHPSLRALPLEGLPGYYRVRVATDVRLLYRRTERQNTVEILSLIDREDLDRYIKQAKTRA